MTTSNTRPSVSRRAALAGLGAGGLGLAFAAGRHGAAAQDAATHPIVGVWMVTTRFGPAPSIFAADGTVTIARPATQAGPQGVAFVSSEVGTWEPISERGVHFTSVHLQSDANGTYTGSVTIDGHPIVSEDGQSFVDDSPDSGPTIRDAAGNVVAAPRGQPPVTGVRMRIGSPGFPEATPTAGTPTS
jgi:hypothetical protein